MSAVAIRAAGARCPEPGVRVRRTTPARDLAALLGGEATILDTASLWPLRPLGMTFTVPRLALCLCLASALPALADSYTIRGAGPCEEWKADPGDRGWVLGYLSGYNAATGGNLTEGMKNDEVVDLMTQICKEDPAQDFDDAVQVLIGRLAAGRPADSAAPPSADSPAAGPVASPPSAPSAPSAPAPPVPAPAPVAAPTTPPPATAPAPAASSPATGPVAVPPLQKPVAPPRTGLRPTAGSR